MKLVIDIDENVYTRIFDAQKTKTLDMLKICNAVRKGKPLPKGHGDLIDRNKIEWYGCTTVFDCPYKERECNDCDKAECWKPQVDDIPAIIEADKSIADWRGED